MAKRKGEKKKERDGTEGCAGRGNVVVKRPSERLIVRGGGYKYPIARSKHA